MQRLNAWPRNRRQFSRVTLPRPHSLFGNAPLLCTRRGLFQIGFNEEVEIPIHDRRDIPGFMIRSVVLDHLVRLEHV